jgi:TolB-like protein
MIESRRLSFLLVVSSLLSGGWSALAAQQRAPTPDIAVYVPALSDTTNRDLRAVAESCVTRLVAKLAAESLVVVRRPSIDLVNLARARPARFAMVGKLELQAGKYSLEWDLVDVTTGDELRAYAAGPALASVLDIADAMAPRIRAAIREQ